MFALFFTVKIMCRVFRAVSIYAIRCLAAYLIVLLASKRAELRSQYKSQNNVRPPVLLQHKEVKSRGASPACKVNYMTLPSRSLMSSECFVTSL